MRRKHRTLAAGALLLSLLLSGCAQETQTVSQIELLEPVGVDLDSAVAYIGDLSQITVYDSAVVPETEELYMTVDGTVKKLYVSLGDWVNEGDVLLELDDSATQEACDALREEIEYVQTVNDYDNRIAQLEIDRLKNQLRQLQAQGGEASREIELKKIEIEQAELNLRQAQETQLFNLRQQQDSLAELESKLGKNQLIAPCAGRVAYALSIQEGDWLSAYKTVAYVTNESSLYLSGDSVSSSQLSGADELYALIEGKRYEISEREMDREEYIALILSVGEAPACFDFQAGESLEQIEAGMYAAVCLVTRQRENVLLIPTNALLRGSGGRYVYVIGENGERVRRAVKIGMSTAWLTEITEGLEEGETVYVKN